MEMIFLKKTEIRYKRYQHFYIDDNYNENLFNMIRKINTREKIVGCIFPVNAYVAIEKAIHENKFRKTFIHIPVKIGAFEAEEVGVEFLLKELKSVSTSTLATKVGDKLSSLKSLIAKLYEISAYLNDILNGNIEMNIKILYNLQNVFSLLPDIENVDLVQAFMVKNNDLMLNIYIGSITRSVIALHNLINNKIENKLNSEKKKSLENDTEKDKIKDKEKEKERKKIRKKKMIKKRIR
ncbi:26S proteasome regulatory subunit RPN8,putative [Plasmodium sp.]|nr:26S proteasome regulatory subunit RPN8,putative [Plasmodium sp.]